MGYTGTLAWLRQKIEQSPLQIWLYSEPPFALTKSATKVPKLGFGESTPDGKRWITVHPWGEDEEGIPVLIEMHPKGKHATVVGGAGGELNGMRLIGIKSEEEYKRESRRREKQAREQKKEERRRNESAQHDRFRQEALDAGKDEKAASHLYHNRTWPGIALCGTRERRSPVADRVLGGLSPLALRFPVKCGCGIGPWGRWTNGGRRSASSGRRSPTAGKPRRRRIERR